MSSRPVVSTRDLLTLVIAGIVAVTGILTLARAVIEYRLQGRQKRAEQFQALRKKLKDTPEFGKIAAALDEAHDPATAASANEMLRTMDFEPKRNYLGLFEEVALALNSGLLSAPVAHYMFGYYAILCAENDAFWSNVGRLSPYWSLFNDFYERMLEEQRELMRRIDDDADGGRSARRRQLRF